MKKLSPTFIDLTQDTSLKVFWYKPSLRFFLQQHKIKESALGQWHLDQTKRTFLQWLWPKLVGNDSGENAILAMARSLSEMEHFPDLERHEESASKIAAAKEAVVRLRREVDKINNNIRESKEAAHRRRKAQAVMEASLAAQQSIEKLNTALTELMPQLGTQGGGYAFEGWFYDLANHFELDARRPYNADGRQIDGSLTYDGTTFLLEAKFTNSPIGSPDIDIFLNKIRTKADNTMGICISISGFNSGAIKEASRPGTPVLMMDHTHIFNLVLNGTMVLPQVISRIKRHAHQTGQSYLAVEDF